MLEAGLASEIKDLVNEKIKVQERFHELKISMDPENEKVIERNKIESKLFDIQTKATEILQESEEIDCKYKNLDKLFEPALLSMFGSELVKAQEKNEIIPLKLEYDDLASVIVPFLQLEFIVNDSTSSNYQQFNTFQSLQRILNQCIEDKKEASEITTKLVNSSL